MATIINNSSVQPLIIPKSATVRQVINIILKYASPVLQQSSANQVAD